MVDGLFRYVGESRDDDQETLLRDHDPLRDYTQIIAWRLACHFQHSGCLLSATKLYSDWMDHPDKQYVTLYSLSKFLSVLLINFLRTTHNSLLFLPLLFFSLTIPESVVPTHLKSIVACTAVAQGGKREWEFAHFKFNTSNSATEKDDMLEAMSCSKQAWILKRFSCLVCI